MPTAIVLFCQQGRGRWPKPEPGGGEGVEGAAGAELQKIRKKPGRKSKAELLAAATGILCCLSSFGNTDMPNGSHGNLVRN